MKPPWLSKMVSIPIEKKKNTKFFKYFYNNISLTFKMTHIFIIHISETVEFILSKAKDSNGADVTNKDGRTCLHIAALTNNVELCKLLLKKKANPQPVMTSKVSGGK